MEFKVGQKYKIVDIDAWWDKEAYPNEYTDITQNFNNGDIVYVGYDNWNRFCFLTNDASSQLIYDLCDNDKWHDSCVELITDDIADVSKMGNERVLMKPIVLKTHPKAVIPTKRKADAGYDLYAVFDKPVVIQKPHEMMIFNTRLKIRFDTDYVSLLRERGSTRLHNLNLGAGVIEGNYSGEYLIMMTNLNEYADVIYANTDVSWNEISKALHEKYPHYGWDESYEVNYKISKDDMGRVAIYDKNLDVVAYIYPQSKAIAQMVITKKEDWQFLS